MNTTKTYGADGNKFGHTDQDAIERFWRHLLTGAASIRFHRPDSGRGLNDKAVACLKAARRVESVVPLWTIQPANELLGKREKNEAYLAADAGRAYVAYFPAGGRVTLDLAKVGGRFQIRWVNIDSGQWEAADQISGGAQADLSPPGEGNDAATIVLFDG
ncbi:MAG: putative collagen-binding domain-containing protein [Pirellulales bacterium]|jgi:hypothetical protein|nr:putative collagen-binding domain-containing protein [Thermoguttaceae bacterium]MDD4786019.1 putative collagen-binding domain-containing protein [Pirellulales bacterium]MDI9446797.1 putative collagen-binding domain-containing protein [Planctomycetota bacterium]NLY99717.1 hypothetical protein [Pirellulaceae bacterium]